MPVLENKIDKDISIFKITNASPVSIHVSNLGASLISIYTPDKNGEISDIILGYDDINGYENGRVFHGGTIGRFANRIKNAQFAIGSDIYHVTKNDGNNCLHGGVGFHKRVFAVKDITENGITFSYTSPDGEDGFPSEINAEASYQLLENSLIFSTFVTNNGDKPTPVSLTNHSYFNLSGKNLPILGHQLQINARAYTPLDGEGIPSGEIISVADTKFDFREMRPLREHFDDNFILKTEANSELKEAAILYDPTSHRKLRLSTTLPALQLYTGSYLDEIGKRGAIYKTYSGLCLEPQFTPDTPNLIHQNKAFPSCLLYPGESRLDRSVYEFYKTHRQEN